MLSHCPGSLWFRQPIPEPVKCPSCGREVEIFTNEQQITCYHCGGIVTKEKRPSCFDWCKYADLCMAELASQRRGAADSLARCPEEE